MDETILEHIHRGEALPTLRLYAWDPPCLSLGHAQSFKDVDIERLQSYGWEVVRNSFSGAEFDLPHKDGDPQPLAIRGWITGAAATTDSVAEAPE